MTTKELKDVTLLVAKYPEGTPPEEAMEDFKVFRAQYPDIPSIGILEPMDVENWSLEHAIAVRDTLNEAIEKMTKEREATNESKVN